ncbi:ABC transporter permease [Halorussus halobius]|uniref:ABC transporter permease n=1 Tax=Halorussus halobius TaxID=1710537 RepID=UPI00109288AB|nr:ABC transporter permease [Halorussus halobius]
MSRTDREDVPLRDRIRDNPAPALRWLAGALVLFALEAGAVVNFVTGVFGPGVELPTLLSRELLPNTGYQDPATGAWQGTFLGLSPAYAWALRVALVYAYSFVVAWWLWRGYLAFREHYRYADWTPRDDMIDRLRGHRWGQFGAIIVFAFVVMAVFAPPLGPTTVEQSISNPYSYEIQYVQDGEVQSATIGQANLDSRSQGNPEQNVGPMQYDDYGRFHPFGTLPTGKDMFTFMMAGARVSLFIGLLSIGISGLIAAGFALLTAYYKGLVDLVVVIAGDSIMSLPRLLFVMLLSVVLSGTWIASVYNGGLLLALIFAGTGWPVLWRAIRGPAMQVAGQEWIDAAKSFGQRPRVTMRKHMAPYIVGYLLVYGSMSLGGIIIGVAGLSFLGLGINPPTPEWGRAVDIGQSYVTTASWHISFIPGVMIVLVVTAFNALGDGIRDAIDPESESGEGEGTEAAAAAGGGA